MRDGSSWLQTWRGIQFYPLDPRPEDILIEDIAHALAHQCRFSGHTREGWRTLAARYQVEVGRG